VLLLIRHGSMVLKAALILATPTSPYRPVLHQQMHLEKQIQMDQRETKPHHRLKLARLLRRRVVIRKRVDL
jgi:hypothetical protein